MGRGETEGPCPRHFIRISKQKTYKICNSQLIDSKEDVLEPSSRASNEDAVRRKKSGRKLLHSMHSYLQSNIYHRL
jgi:hypothetical protein